MNILFSRVIGPVPVAVILREGHQSDLGITEQPVESGAKITDHAYLEPKRLTLEFADANGAATYNALVRFQESRTPFTLVSGLYVYNDMLIKSLSADRDVKNGSILVGQAQLQQVIIVSTAYASADSDATGSNGGNSGKSGEPGGKGSTRAARPSTGRAGDKPTGERGAGTVTRGDQGGSRTVNPAERKSLLLRAFGS